MDKIYPEEHIQAIANAIRRKNGKSVNYLTSEMAGAIDQLVSYPEPTGTQTITENGIVDVKDKEYADVNVQATPTLISKTITANGEYDAEDDEADGYSDVTVNVPNSYVAADEGKVVSSGELVAQGSQTITQNGTYDTTLIDELIATIEGGGGGDLSQYDIIKNVVWEQGSSTLVQGSSYDTTKISSDTRIRSAETMAVDRNIYYFTINSGFQVLVGYFNMNDVVTGASSWGEYTDGGVVRPPSNTKYAFFIRKTNGNNITPSGISDAGFALYDITALIEDGGCSGGIQTGTTPPTSDIGSDGDYYKQMSPLADNVDFVEYLESNGTQYINTGIYPDSGYGIYAEVYRTDTWIAGSRQGNASSKGLNVVGNTEVTNGISLDYNGTRYNNSVATGTLNILKFLPNLTAGGSSYAVLQNGTKYWVIQKGSYTLTNPFILFGIGKEGSVTITTGAKIKRVALYDGLTLVADYLPCLDGNGVACMWENIAKEYVYNDGTGDFTYGSTTTPDGLEPVLWVKESGTWRVVGS